MKSQYWIALGAVLIGAYTFSHRHAPTSLVASRPSLPAPRAAALPSAPAATSPLVASRAATPSPPARVYTARDVLDLDARPDGRVEAMYQLTRSGVRAAGDLKRIAAEPLPKDPTRQVLETTIRITALEALDQLALEGVDVKDTFAAVLAQNSEGALQTMALIGLKGLEEGRPGKIKRFIDGMVD